jgi:selenium metabolism protein YedF
VDNQQAAENITRFAETSGCQVTRKKNSRDFAVTITKKRGAAPPAPTVSCAPAPAGNTVVLIKADTIGRGSDELGGVLMKACCAALRETAPRLDTLICMNSGVKLTVAGAPHLEDLRALEKKGTRILVCGTCLDYFQVKARLKVGTISNFFEITQVLLEAGKVIEF